MFRPTPQLFRRSPAHIRLTTKRAAVGGGYYKGNRTGSLGRHTKHGGYIIDWRKVRTYVCPENLNESILTPFVTRKMEPLKGRYGPLDRKDWIEGPMSGKRYLTRWKLDNGHEDIERDI